MKKTTSLVALLFVLGVLVAGAAPALSQQVLLKVQLAGTDYCHLQFPQIDPETLYSGQPALSDPKSGDIVDFYGPCDHDPMGKEEIANQQRLAMSIAEDDSE